MAWDPRIVAAAAFSRDHFAVAYGELEYDDPFTVVLEYSGSFPQPWSRTDIRREIKAIAPWAPADGDDARFVAMSDEGDVYFVGDETRREKIPGAGIASEDASGAGGVLGLANLDGVLHAAGQGEQVFRRGGAQGWERLAVDAPRPADFQPIAFDKTKVGMAGDLYLLGRAAPNLSDLVAAMEQSVADQDDWGAMSDVYQSYVANGGADRVTEGRVVHWDGTRFRLLDLPMTEIVHDVLVEAPDKVWMVGGGGAILLGDPQAGFRRMTPHDASLSFLSVARFGEAYYLASDRALHRLDGREMCVVRPSRMLRLDPFGVQAVEDVLFYFDYRQGVQRYDGAAWERIDIPRELLERNGRPRLKLVR